MRYTQPEWGAYVIDLTNGAMRKVYGGDTTSAESPVLCPDGASLALELSRGPSDSARNVVVVSIASGKRTWIAKNGIEPAWQPGGSFIAYHNDDRDAAGEIHLSKSDGSSDTIIYRNAAITHFNTGWGYALEGNPSSRLVWSPMAASFSSHAISNAAPRLATRITAPARETGAASDPAITLAVSA